MHPHLHAQHGCLLSAGNCRREGHHVGVHLPGTDRLPTSPRHQPAAAVLVESASVRQIPSVRRHRRRLLHHQHCHFSQLELAYSQDSRTVTGHEKVLLQVPGWVPDDETTRRPREHVQPATGRRAADGT